MSEKQTLVTMQRDPKEVNIHNEVHFNDVFGEPEHVSSLSCTWLNTKKVFTHTHQKCYMILTTIFGLPLAVLWGLKFACTSFWSIWCCRPALVSARHIVYHIQKTYSLFIRCCLDPFLESIGMIFSNIRVTVASQRQLSADE